MSYEEYPHSITVSIEAYQRDHATLEHVTARETVVLIESDGYRIAGPASIVWDDDTNETERGEICRLKRLTVTYPVVQKDPRS